MSANRVLVNDIMYFYSGRYTVVIVTYGNNEYIIDEKLKTIQNNELFKDFVSIVTYILINPYIYSITIGLISIIIATIVPSIKMLRLMPLQAYYNNTPKTLHSRKLKKKSAIILLNTRLKNSLDFLITISFILSMSSCAFGLLYFNSFTDNQPANYRHKIDKNGFYSCDYIIYLDYFLII